MTTHGFVVVLIGHVEVDGHTEYIFHIGNAGGGTWRVQRRFSDLLAAHRMLGNKLLGLPAFPSKSVPGLGAILGQDFIRERKVALQRYFQAALATDAVAHSADFQRTMMGVRRPDAIVKLRVHRWLPPSERLSGHYGTTSVELDAVAEECGRSGHRLVENLVATVPQLTTIRAGGIAPLGSPLQVHGLPCGEDVSIEVRAQNRVGSSEPVTIQLRVPGERQVCVVAGMRVRAIWAGDSGSYDAAVQRVCPDGTVVVNWLRPAPLSNETLICVCETGGDDTAHRIVSREHIVPLAEASDFADHVSSPLSPERSGAREGSSPSSCELEGTIGEEETPIFRLSLRLCEEVVPLEWQRAEELPSRVDTLLQAHRLNALLREPLLRRAAHMASLGQRAGTVDMSELALEPGCTIFADYQI